MWDVGCGSRGSGAAAPLLSLLSCRSRTAPPCPDLQLTPATPLPSFLRRYVHRVGRTGRAGEAGAAVTLLAPADAAFAAELDQMLAERGGDQQQQQQQQQQPPAGAAQSDDDASGSDSDDEAAPGGGKAGKRGGGGSGGLRTHDRLTKAAVEALRYRAEDVARSITRNVIKEVRLWVGVVSPSAAALGSELPAATRRCSAVPPLALPCDAWPHLPRVCASLSTRCCRCRRAPKSSARADTSLCNAWLDTVLTCVFASLHPLTVRCRRAPKSLKTSCSTASGWRPSLRSTPQVRQGLRGLQATLRCCRGVVTHAARCVLRAACCCARRALARAPPRPHPACLPAPSLTPRRPEPAQTRQAAGGGGRGGSGSAPEAPAQLPAGPQPAGEDVCERQR